MADEINYSPSKEVVAILENYRLMDDDFMTLFFNQNFEATELVLDVILNRSDIKVKVIEVQKRETNPAVDGRNVVLDILAVDSEGKNYDIEIQRADSGAGTRRARFLSSVIDYNMLKVKQDFSELRDSYVIFITENDVMKEGLPMYHINRHIEELSNKRFDDGNHIIYVNGAYKNDSSDIGKLMHDFRCNSSVDMFYDVLKRGMHHYKETEGGRATVCKAIENYGEKQRLEGKTEGKIEGKIEGAIETKIDNAKKMISKGKLELDEIAEYSGLPLDEVKELAGVKTA